MNEFAFTRRDLFDLLSRAATLPGAAVFLGSWLEASNPSMHQMNSDAPPQPSFLSKYQPMFFSKDDFAALQAFTEILIPTDEDPGAREAYCAQFIDFLLQASNQSPQMQTAWRKAIQTLKDAGFHTADSQRRQQWIREISRPERERGAEHPAYVAYRLIKDQTVFAFYTSRVGMIDVLNYKGNSYNLSFPACTHPEHQRV